MVDAHPDLEKGHRQRHSVVELKFEVFYPNESDNSLYASKKTKPARLNAITDCMGEIYEKERTEFIGDALNTNHSVQMTIYEPTSVWVLEHHDRGIVTVQIKERDVQEYTQLINKQFSEEMKPHNWQKSADEIIDIAPR